MKKIKIFMTIFPPGSKKTWVLIWAFFCLIVLLLTPLETYAQPETVVRVDPPSITLEPGQTAEIEIWVDDVVGMRAFDVHVQFDPTKLSGAKLTDAGFIPGLFEAPTNGIDNEAGLVKFGVAQGNGDLQSGSGVLFSFEITVIGPPGETHLTIILAELVREDYELISCDTSHGIVMITGEPIPAYEVFLPLILQ